METIKDILMMLIQTVLITMVPLLAKFAIDLLRVKTNQINNGVESAYVQNIIATISKVISDSVLFVTQTYVENLKNGGKFNKEEQKIALNMAYTRIMSLIDEESKRVLTEIFGDVGLWVHTLIEANVKVQKEESAIAQGSIVLQSGANISTTE